MNVGRSKCDGKHHIYDITKIEDITDGTAGQALIKAAGSVSTSSTTSISQNSEKSTPETKKSRKVQHSYKGRNETRGIMLVRGARKGERGITADSVAQEPESINIDGIVKQEVAENGVTRQYSPPSDISISDFFKKSTLLMKIFTNISLDNSLEKNKIKRYSIRGRRRIVTVEYCDGTVEQMPSDLC